MLPRLTRSRLKSLSLMLAAGALALSASVARAQTTGVGGTTGGGGTAGGGTAGGGTIGGGGGGGGGGVGAGRAIGANGPGGQAAQALAPGTNFSPAQATATNTAGAAGANSAAVVPSPFNPFRASYSNPYAIGAGAGGNVNANSAAGKAGSNVAKAAFGQPVYATNANATGVRGVGGIGGIGGVGNTGVATSAAPFEFNTAAMRKTPGYTTSLSDEFPLPVRVPAQVATNLRSVLDRSSQLRSQGTIQVRVENEVVVLTGTVANDRERRLAENLLRLTPGVADVVNELQIR
ncbi:MAG: BON domain-containing protein [Gemmataceae bacterium]|nr:BON domain-containing protein [Gemmataceae bacterium]